MKNNLEKYISEKKLTKFCEELFYLICELTPRKVFLEDYTWPKPEKRDYLNLGIAVPEFLKHSDDK